MNLKSNGSFSNISLSALSQLKRVRNWVITAPLSENNRSMLVLLAILMIPEVSFVYSFSSRMSLLNKSTSDAIRKEEKNLYGMSSQQ